MVDTYRMSIGVLFIVAGAVWFAFLGKLSIRRYHGKRRIYRGVWGLLAGYAVWPRKYDTLAIILQSVLLLGFGAAILVGWA